MKKLTLITTFFFFLLNYINAQLSHPHFLSLNFGTDIPVGEYKKVDSLASSGANTGLYYSFEAGAYFSKVLGFGVSIGAFNNSIDGSISEQLEAEVTGPQGDFQINSDRWKNGYIMLGPYLSFGSQSFIVDLKLLGGIVNSEKPFVSIQSSSDKYQFQSGAVSNAALGVNYGMHFRIKLMSKLGLRINAEGISSNQEFVESVKRVDAAGNETTTEETIKREISVLNLGLGLVINL